MEPTMHVKTFSRGSFCLFVCFAMCNHKVSWGVGFLLFALPSIRYPCSTSDWLFCSARAEMLREGKSGLGGRRSHGLVDTYSIVTAFSKACFQEGGRICLAAPLWAASQCLPGRTAGRHILQTPASFVLLENVAHWYSKKYYRKSCDMESLGMPLHLSFEFSVRRCKGTLVGLDRVLQLQGGRVWI